ncbi:MAG: hypothetical protein HY925_03250, partial [Elusimicrobia bacterium]|nr:hypothetical protein [Elusimicrobiota bacterium]
MKSLIRFATAALLSAASFVFAVESEAAKTMQSPVAQARVLERDPLTPAVDSLHFQASFKLVARGLKELEGWFYAPGLGGAPWNRERGWWEGYGEPHANYGEGEFPVGALYDAYQNSAPPCQTVLEYTGGGHATQDYREYLRECQAARARVPRFNFERAEDWKFIEQIDLHRQVNAGRFPEGQFLTARLGSAERQTGGWPYFIETIEHPQGTLVPQSPLIRSEDWYFRLSPSGSNCMSGSIRVQLPGATVKLDPTRLIYNWADHGWGVQFPGARIHLTGLSAEPRFEFCLDSALEPTASVQEIKLTVGGARMELDGDLDVDAPFANVLPYFGPQIINAIAQDNFEDSTDPAHLDRAFGRVKAKIEERVRAALDEELQKLVATLPRAKESLRDGCVALEAALDGGILASVPRAESRERVRNLVADRCAALTGDDTAPLT